MRASGHSKESLSSHLDEDETTHPVQYDYPEKDPSSKPRRINIYRGIDQTIITLLTRLVVPSLAIFFGVCVWTGSTSLAEVYPRLHARVHALQQQYRGYVADYVLISALALCLCILALYLRNRKERVYLVDFATWQPIKDWEVSVEWFCDRIKTPHFTQESIEFQHQIAPRSGLGDRTAWTKAQQPKDSKHCMIQGRDETLTVFSGALDELLAKTGLDPKEIDILVVNCGLYNPTPSFASMMINKYKMRSDILSYNLASMGCSAGAIAADLARELLENHPNSFAVVLSTECVANTWYLGNEKNKLVSNCLFRCGASAALFTNKSNINAKYELECTVRICTAADDDSYRAIYYSEDDKGIKGASLVSARYLLPVVSDALRKNMALLGPKVLPYSEQIKFLAVELARMVFGKKKIQMYIPNFKKAFQHFCIHAGGKAIIDGMEQKLNLSARDVEPARATLYRMGNTSSSSIWYEFFYVEAANGVKKGEKVWQLAFGAGMKCNSLVWRALRDIPKSKR